MSKAKTVSRELRICLAIWRKAYRERENTAEPVFVQCRNGNECVSIRQSLYRAARPIRAGEQFDEEVRAAIDLFVVWHDKSTNRLVMRERSSLGTLESSLDELGLEEGDLLLPEEKMTDVRLKEFLGEDRASTPFYERD